MDKDDDQAEALRRIKEIHAKGGRRLTRAEAIELIEHPMYLGVPKPNSPKTRGRKPKTVRTQYDESFDLRRGLYQRLRRLPTLRAGKRNFQHEEIKRLFMELLAERIPPRKLVAEASTRLQLLGAPCPESRTLRRILAEIRPNFPK